MGGQDLAPEPLPNAFVSLPDDSEHEYLLYCVERFKELDNHDTAPDENLGGTDL